MQQKSKAKAFAILEARLNYAAMGFHTFLIPPGTRRSYKSAKNDPQGRRWGATNEPDEIKQECADCPDAEPGIGIATGAVSGIWVVDYESLLGHGVDGLGERAKLEAEYGSLPATLSAATATAGRHDYWRWPSDVDIQTSKSILRPGVDILSTGNMVVAPPTTRFKDGEVVGAYRWLNAGTPIVEAPAWLVKLAVEAGAQSKPQREGGAKRDEPVPDFLADLHAEMVANLMSLIPNNDWIGVPNRDNFEFNWDEWNTMMMRLWDTTNGSFKGLQIAHDWSHKNSKYNPNNVEERWRTYASSPPSEVSVATIHWYARRADPDRYLEIVEKYNHEVDKILYRISKEATRKARERRKLQQNESGDEQKQEEQQDEAPDAQPTPPSLLKNEDEFITSLAPPDYLIDGFLQRRFIYSFTGLTGSGKTAVALLLAASVALGRSFGNKEVEKGIVLFFAGENPDDVRMRWIKLREELKITTAMDVHFLDGAIPIGDMASNRMDVRQGIQNRAQIEAEVEAIGPVSLIIIDTNTAYFKGDDENDNVQAATHARMLRSFVELDGGPTIIVTCHPTKNASLENLLPRGGGAFLNEMDGNLVAIRQPGSHIVTIETHGKFRGPEFAPIPFRIVPGTSDRLKDSKERKIWTVTAKEITDAEQEAMDDALSRNQETVLSTIKKNPNCSVRELADLLGWKYKDDKPDKSRVQRAMKSLKKEHLITMIGDGHAARAKITPKGEKRLKELTERPI
jgi:DNA-binding MarR family transcriptional regulator